VIASVLVGMYYDNSIRVQLTDEIIGKIKLKDEIIKSGITSYYSNFGAIDLKKYFAEAKKVDIYVNYANTLFNQIGDTIEIFLQTKKREINIYLLSEDNKFIQGLGAHWGYNDSGSDETQIKTKIASSIALLIKTCTQLKSKNKLKAKITISKLNRHPVFYSFYRFDDIIILVPSKLVQSKNFRPLAFIAENGEYEDDIYKKCSKELEDIKSSENALTVVYSNK